jgi:hypothetical protein
VGFRVRERYPESARIKVAKLGDLTLVRDRKTERRVVGGGLHTSQRAPLAYCRQVAVRRCNGTRQT